MPLAIAGIGYQGRSAESLTQTLAEAGVSTVVDVRETPWSRKAGLSKTKLSERLAESGIRYVHLREAGNPKEIRRAAQSMEECLAGYRAHVACDPSFLKDIFEIAQGSLVALLCYEADGECCHRSVIFEELASRYDGVTVIAL